MPRFRSTESRSRLAACKDGHPHMMTGLLWHRTLMTPCWTDFPREIRVFPPNQTGTEALVRSAHQFKGCHDHHGARSSLMSPAVP